MIRTSIAYTDDIGGLPVSSTLNCAIGEYKTMVASFKVGSNCSNLDDVIVRYNHAFAMTSPDYPNSDNCWKFTLISGLATGIYYPMQLSIDGITQGIAYQAAKNDSVEIRKDDNFNFTIRHKFYIIDDVNGFITEQGQNNYSKWFQQPDISGQSLAQNNQIGNSAYDVSKYFVTSVDVIDIKTTKSDRLLNYDPITALYYDNFPVNTSSYTSNWTDNNTTFIVGQAITTTVSFDSALHVPTKAKLLLINTSPNSSLNIIPGIIESISIPAISVVGTTYTLTGTLTAASVIDKEIIAIVYYGTTSVVVSAKLGNPTTGSLPNIPNNPLQAIIGCYPDITSNYKDYNTTNIGACIESTPYERIIAGFQVSKTVFHKVGLGAGCFPLGFDGYSKYGTFKLYAQDTGEVFYSLIFNYNAMSGIWDTGDLLFSDSGGFLNFGHEYRNIGDYLGRTIVASFEMYWFYTYPYAEGVKIESENRVLNFDNALAVPRIDKIQILDPTTFAVIDEIDSNIMSLKPTCLDQFVVRVCKQPALIADAYNIIAIFHEQGNNLIDEEESYIGLLTQLDSSYYSSVPANFGGLNCKDFNLDVSGIDRTKIWEVIVIIKKI